MSTRILRLITTALLFNVAVVFAQQDSVDVRFVYYPSAQHTYVFLPGEFNNWGPNTNGVIQPGAPSQMEFDADLGHWHKTVRLRVGGHLGGGVAGAYQYKFNLEGSSGGWIQDPRNPRENPFDHNNSILYITNPTIYHLLPNPTSGIVETRTPTIGAYLFPATNTEIDPETIEVTVSGNVYSNLAEYFNGDRNYFSFQLPDPLPSGTHTLKLVAGTVDGSLAADSTEFTVEAGFIRLLTRSNPRYLRDTITIEGIVASDDIPEITLYHNDDPMSVTVTDGFFSHTVSLSRGENMFYAIIEDPLIEDNESDPITIHYFVDLRPRPRIIGSISNDYVHLEIEELNAVTVSNETQYAWTSDDSINPLPLGIEGEIGPSVSFALPDLPGEYYIDVLAERIVYEEHDLDGDNANGGELWTGSARTYVRVYADGTGKLASVEGNPSWVQNAIVYEIYVPAFAAGGGGTFQHVINRLPEMSELGINVIWFMPIHDNNESINELNAGYNIADFYSVHPQLGTMEKFDELVAKAHEKGIRIILDSTPNHIGGLHPWLDDLRAYRDYSIYRPMIENRLLGSPRDLGHSIVRLEDNYPLYARYSNWTLPNLNYQNPETFDYMMEMYKWWVQERNIDGYRMDVYWGPQNRYGADAWWRPFREEIKRVRPDIFILGETDGTGLGSEHNYADFGGAADAAYDWNLYGYIRTVLGGSGGGNVNELHNRVNNFAPAGERYNYHTGPNSHIFRFIENHDEPRIAQLFGTAKARAGAVLNLTIPGIPLIYAGQEVGETSRRGTINWNRTGAQQMREFYKRLTYSRNTFPAFTTKYIRRVQSNHSRVYAFSRPYEDQNAIVAINFSSSTATANLQIDDTVVDVSTGGLKQDKVYYLNDVLNDSSTTVTKADLASYQVTLAPWESVVYVLSDTLIRLVTSADDIITGELPREFKLYQNYPNPFNPVTSIQYSIPQAAHVTLHIYDVLGRRVATLVDEFKTAGTYLHHFDASQLSSGMYFYRIEAGDHVDVKRMIYLK